MSKHLVEQLEEAVGMPKTGEISPLLAWSLLNKLRHSVASNTLKNTNEVAKNGG
jgi:hypothetical protein